jgi:tRNA U34 5-carboxymethylaminomethyl modifying GTPase MnmE/TrmE
MRQLEGKHSEVYRHMRTELIRMLAHVEAYIDFEADEVSEVQPEVFARLFVDAEKMQR